MVCGTCGKVGHYSEVLGEGFYYCRNCKVEIELNSTSGEDVDYRALKSFIDDMDRDTVLDNEEEWDA